MHKGHDPDGQVQPSHRTGPDMGDLKGGGVLVDGHVHFHLSLDPWAAIEGAVRNFSSARRHLARPADCVGVLMYVRNTVEGPLRTLLARLSRSSPSGWELELGTNEGWLLARRPGDGFAVYVVEGQQVRASNGLEVLALGCTARFEGSMAFAATVERVLGSGAITVIPWGFGKWLGSRRREVARALDTVGPGRLFLGDNASRPALLPDPSLFRRARDLGIYVLPGSDPLALPGEERSVGRFGFIVDGFDVAHPAESIRAALFGLDRQPEVFGHRQGLLRSLHLQIRLRTEKAKPDPAAG